MTDKYDFENASKTSRFVVYRLKKDRFKIVVDDDEEGSVVHTKENLLKIMKEKVVDMEAEMESFYAWLERPFH
jgi:hypothetical protein